MIGLILFVETVLAQAGPAELTAADTFFKWFWTAVVFASIAWYAFLLFWLGTKGGIEIFRMIRVLKEHATKYDAK